MPKLGELNFADPSPNKKKYDDDDDIGVIRSTLSGIASGVFKIPEGAFSLGANLLDFGLGTNTAASVEKFFDTINPFDEAAEATTAGRIAELIVNIGVPGGIAFRAGKNLTKAAIAAKQSGNYFTLTGKGLADDVISKGMEYGIQPIGLGARDTLRLEMGFCLHGNDIDDSINPIEAGLGWICKKDIDFIGKDIVDRDRSSKPSKILIGFKLIEKGIPRKGYKIFNKEKELVGEVTSGSISPYSKKAIGMGYVNYKENTISEKIFIEIRSKNVEGKIVKRPFI